jgi:hypothetical protein
MFLWSNLWSDTLKANPDFVLQPKEFWAHVRTISQEVGYTERGKGTIKIPSLNGIKDKFAALGLSTMHIATEDDQLTNFGKLLFQYFEYRANILNNVVHSHLMNKDAAEIEFNQIKMQLNPQCPLPMNKQKAEKKNYAFLTGIVNMLVEANIGDVPCDYDPRTLARRVDGAFPSVVNPIAIWEIKEYYYTTTFGSRVADGVYETLLDGMELEELHNAIQRKVQHILFIDDHFTWWECGRSYLCRMIDMLHMGYVDEVIFGREVLTRLPELAQEWRLQYDELYL